ncbi:unnamed protein product, partial [Ixodes persulcatus]
MDVFFSLSFMIVCSRLCQENRGGPDQINVLAFCLHKNATVKYNTSAAAKDITCWCDMAVPCHCFLRMLHTKFSRGWLRPVSATICASHLTVACTVHIYRQNKLHLNYRRSKL